MKYLWHTPHGAMREIELIDHGDTKRPDHWTVEFVMEGREPLFVHMAKADCGSDTDASREEHDSAALVEWLRVPGLTVEQFWSRTRLG